METIIEHVRHTVADFEKLPEGTLCQLIDGEIIMSPSPLFEHQNIVSNLMFLMRTFIGKNQSGKVIPSPMDVYLDESEVYQPDIIYISNENSKIIRDRVHGAPDLVVEILSPSNGYYDLVHKKKIYEQSGVKEYWIVDPMEKTVDIFENKTGKYVLISQSEKTGTVKSGVLKGFEVNLTDLF